MSGASNSFPFLYHGLEHEVTDPGQLYFEPSGNVYNPQIQSELSQVGQQGISGPPSDGGGGGYGGLGNFGGHSGSPGGPSGLSTAFNDLEPVAIAAGSVYLTSSPFEWLPFGFGSETATKIPIPLLANLLNLFNFGGGSSDSEKPYQDDHQIHPIYMYLEISPGLTPDQVSIVTIADTDKMVPIPPLNLDPSVPPGPGWEWKGSGPEGSNSGSWYNPFTGWALHPDYGTHDLPKGDHYDLQKRGFPKHSLRMQGPRLQLWSDGLQKWQTIFNFEWFTF